MNQQDLVAIITSQAKVWSVDPKLAVAIAIHESSLNPNAVAGAGTPDAVRGGSYGLMQMSLKTAQGLGFKGTTQDLLDPTKNAFYGCLLLHQLGKRKGFTVNDVICAYNSGKPEASAPASTVEHYLPSVLELLGAQNSSAAAADTAQSQ